MPSTIVLVHGAFAESSSWDGVAGASHAVAVSRPATTAGLILEAAAALPVGSTR